MWGESEYRVDYIRRKIKESIGFRMTKVTVYYYRKDSVDSMFTFILDFFDKKILIEASKKASHSARDGNGYPRSDTRWVFTPLGYICGLNILPVGLLLGKNLHPMGKRVLKRSTFTHTR